MGPEGGQAAWHYHNLSKHSAESLRRQPHTLDWKNQPLPFKIYTNPDRISLPPLQKTPPVPTLAALAAPPVSESSSGIPSRDLLSRIFYSSAGITKRKAYPGGEMLFRAAACTGALYEIEFYLVCRDLPGLTAGVYHFNARDFALDRLRSGDYRGVLVAASGKEPFLEKAPAVVVSTGTYWRNAWKYRTRTYRHFGWDNGTMLANLLAVCAAEQLPARLILGFVDREVNRLLDLDTRREVSLSLLALSRDPSSDVPAPPPLPGLGLPTVPLSPEETDYPEMRRMHQASSLERAEQAAGWRSAARHRRRPSPRGPVFPLVPFHPDRSAPLQAVIRRRGSSRQFRPRQIPFARFSAILEGASRGLAADFLQSGPAFLNDWYLIVHAVESLPAGSYVFHPRLRQLELLAKNDFRSTAGYLALGQRLAADASFDLFFLADLKAVLERYGNRGYRAVQLEAGILGGRLYLGAYALGLGATGLTFFDDDVSDFFSPHARDKAAIFLVAVGRGRKPQLISI